MGIFIGSQVMGTTILPDSVIARKCNKLWMKIRGHGKDRKMNGPSYCGCSPLFLFSQDQCVRVLLNPTKANHQSPPGIVWRGRWVKHWMNILKGGTALAFAQFMAWTTHDGRANKHNLHAHISWQPLSHSPSFWYFPSTHLTVLGRGDLCVKAATFVWLWFI